MLQKSFDLFDFFVRFGHTVNGLTPPRYKGDNVYGKEFNVASVRNQAFSVNPLTAGLLISLGAKIARLRKQAGLTQAQLAEHVGVHSVTVSKWEHGTQQVNSRYLSKLASALGVQLSDLVNLNEIVSRDTVREPQPDYGITALDQLLGLLERHDALKAALRRVPVKALIRIARAIATDWSPADRKWLDQVGEHILKEGARAIPITVKEDARAAAERIDVADRVAQLREGAPPELPRGERRRKPRHARGNRGG